MIERKGKGGPGQAHREGVGVLDFFRAFPTDKDAEDWFVVCRWPEGVRCPKCGGERVYEPGGKAPQRFRCRPCRRYFSPKTGTVLESSNLGYQAWLFAMFLMHTSLKGVSSMKLHRDLTVTQKTAWHLGHRIRKIWERELPKMVGSVEIDETFVGGKERNKHVAKRLPREEQVWDGRRPHGKAIVVGAKQRESGKVRASVVHGTDRKTLRSFVRASVERDSSLFTDDNTAYQNIPDYAHESVRHSAGEYVRGQAHTNGIESFWNMLKRGYIGTYHKMSLRHLHRYVSEFEGRHNARQLDTMDQLALMTHGIAGKRLRYRDLAGKEKAA